MAILEETIAEIERVSIDQSVVEAFEREAQYFELAFNLFRETAQWVCVFASVLGPRQSWSVPEAILGGHLVRLFKLTRCVLEVVQERAELMWIFLRLSTECVINFRFLVANASDELFASYMHQSLQHDRALLRRIDENVAARGGTVLPIEERMRRSVARTFEKSAVNISDLPENKIQNWGGKNLFEKAQDIGLDNAYFAIFGGPSRNVHGGWRDLLEHHLRYEAPGRFTPRLEFSRGSRPQALFATAFIIMPALLEYINLLGTTGLEVASDRLEDLRARVALADELHERFLERRSNSAMEPSARPQS
jgi:hypothetical protein